MITNTPKHLKAVTFSYDDGVTQDIRFVELLNKYGLKCTFNINSGRFGRPGELSRESVDGKTLTVRHDCVNEADVRSIYEGHEVAAHTLTHPFLPNIEDDAEVVRQVEEDRLRLSETVGYEVFGFAYPGGGENCNDRISELVRTQTGVKYARTIRSSGKFDMTYGDGLFTLSPTAYHRDIPKLYELANAFFDAESDEPMLLYIWGHTYEFDLDDAWDEFEDFLKFISHRDGIFYGTNRDCLGI